MTKKDYQAIARVIHNERDEWETADSSEQPLAYQAIDEITLALAKVFFKDNPRFDRERFIEACETGHCKGMRRRT